ncbi:MAG: chromosome segregation protein SMC [Chloroflexi bacterium]|nr:chromosome segregation protein SMC [Chloroflexota bacterium]
MHLKFLTLNGYKTFASKAQFEFGAGITCIIGPNGSGKSNIADGIRWALGEQQFSLLRGKRTDDMIFSGSAKRSRASMAEVILTFDNSDGFFPIEFNEIEIGRRAYRDGANEYVLNSNRVRLRDVGDLLSHSGLSERTYTVIGQGLVDNALAQKPEERRALFEEAAGIASYRDRREDALRKLEETRHNLERARDILSEITPRLNSLERQATRVRQYQLLKAELDELTKRYFGYYHRRVLQSIADAGATRDRAQQAADDALTTVNALDAAGEALRDQRRQLTATAVEIQPRRDIARRESESTARSVAVMRERLASADVQVARAQRDLDEHAASIQDARRRANTATMHMASTRADWFSHRAELEHAQAASSGDRQRKDQLEAQRNAARQQLIAAGAAVVGAQRQITIARERQQALRRRIAALESQIAQAMSSRDSELAQRARLIAALDDDARRAVIIHERFTRGTELQQQATAALNAAQSALAAADAEEKLTSRFKRFAEMRTQQSADDLAQALIDSRAAEVRGTLKKFIQVLPDDLKAVEAALGDLLHAVLIAGDSSEAGAANLARMRTWLTKRGSGRLSVIPDSLRVIDAERVSQDAALAEFARSRGARRLLDSIKAPESLQPVLQLLAGGAFIARDLAAARELARELVDGCVVVTRDGEAAYPVGTLILPAGERVSQKLGAEVPEEEIASLPDPETARKNREAAQAHVAASQRVLHAAKTELDEAVRARDALAREEQSRRRQIDDIGRKAERFEENLNVLRNDVVTAEGEITSIDGQVVELDEELARQKDAQTRAQREVQDFEAQLSAVLAGGRFEAVRVAQSSVALARAAVQNGEQMINERLIAQRTVIAQRESRAQRITDATVQRERVQAELTSLVDAAARAETAWSAAEAELTPVQQQIAVVDQQLSEQDMRRRDGERALRECDARLNAAVLDLARNNDALESMRARAGEMIAAEAEVEMEAAPSESEFGAERLSLVDEFLRGLPEVEQLPVGLEDRMNQLRGQIKRLGAINLEAQAEYDELRTRFDFITEQSGDLTQASDQLRQVIAELNDVIKVTFRQTFDLINEAFQGTFKVLFGGGQAKLTLINSDDIDEAGVEIQAQPPGKRPQSLALLSGGERSLTATALLFAILQVKPTPFCVLDEVDAALDESNVGRFRSMVESLSDQTQFIIITHNRRTVEAASTIYGISMAADGASTVLSLRLDDVT